MWQPEGHVVLSDLLVPPIYARGRAEWTRGLRMLGRSVPHKGHHLYANPSAGFQEQKGSRGRALEAARLISFSPKKEEIRLVPHMEM